MSVDRSSWPAFVRLGLFGLPNRASAQEYYWLMIAISVGFIAIGLWEPVFLLGGGLLAAARWYYAAIRWVDLNGNWS